MQIGLNRTLRILLLAVAVALITVSIPAFEPIAFAQSADEQTTEDVLHMSDGRVLHGRIISESDTIVRFEVVDREFGISSTMTYLRSAILKIERDVTITDESGTSTEKKPRLTTRKSKDAVDSTGRQLERADAPLHDVPTFYVIPLKGQMGTDIHPTIVKPILKNIEELKPDVVVFELDSKERDDLMIPLNDRREAGLFLMDEYRVLVSDLRDGLAGYRQVMWVHDAEGMSSLMAMAWPEMYMASDARLTGIRQAILKSGAEFWRDEDVREKMKAAFSGWIKSFFEYGKGGMNGLRLADAMIWPDKRLSATFVGRSVRWQLNTSGDYIVDNSSRRTVSFRAQTAENLTVCDGIADSYDDLALLLGYREYRVLHGDALRYTEDYTKRWRRAFEQSIEDYEDFVVAYERRGDDPVLWTGKALRHIREIISAMNRYKAVELRWGTDFGMGILDLEYFEEVLKQEMRALKARG